MDPNRVFIFDMDGVLIDTERAWEEYGSDFLINLLGREIAEKVGGTIGLNVHDVYRIAASHGFDMDKDEYLRLYDRQAEFIYSKAKITEDIDKLANELIESRYVLGLVSGSGNKWIGHVLPRLSFRDYLKHIISLSSRRDLKPKPYPDGYTEAINKLGGAPHTTIILEDSNPGIRAAKASGAYTIGFRKNLVSGYEQTGADIYADEIEDVIQIIRDFRW